MTSCHKVKFEKNRLLNVEVCFFIQNFYIEEEYINASSYTIIYSFIENECVRYCEELIKSNIKISKVITLIDRLFIVHKLILNANERLWINKDVQQILHVGKRNSGIPVEYGAISYC